MTNSFDMGYPAEVTSEYLSVTLTIVLSTTPAIEPNAIISYYLMWAVQFIMSSVETDSTPFMYIKISKPALV